MYCFYIQLFINYFSFELYTLILITPKVHPYQEHCGLAM